MNNSLMVVFPYKYQDTWVFDDAEMGLTKEPFVFGIPEMIDRISQDIPEANKGFKLIFSVKPFPGFQQSLIWVKEEYEGNWYKFSEQDLEGWLCPALLCYFENAPKKIYIKAESKHNRSTTLPR